VAYSTVTGVKKLKYVQSCYMKRDIGVIFEVLLLCKCPLKELEHRNWVEKYSS